MQYLVGADPELFVRNNTGFLSGHLFPCGTKTNPLRTKNGAVQVDGIALEFNVTPSETRDAFVTNLKGVLADLNEIVAQCHPGSFLEAIPTAHVGMDFLHKVPPENSQLGCNPDFNAYFMEENPLPDAELPFRTGSGHVHVGFCYPDESLLNDPLHFERSARVARQLDFFLGLPSLDWDADNERRALYGKAGAFRPKPYGMEYRVLSNRWVADEGLAGYVFDQTQRAMKALDDGNDLSEKYGMDARKAIDFGNVNWKTDLPEIAAEVL